MLLILLQCEPRHGESTRTIPCPLLNSNLVPKVVTAVRKSERATKVKLFISDDLVIDELKYTKLLASKNIPMAQFHRLKGSELNLDYIKNIGLSRPVLVEKMDGLEMQMPPNTLTVLTSTLK